MHENDRLCVNMVLCTPPAYMLFLTYQAWQNQVRLYDFSILLRIIACSSGCRALTISFSFILFWAIHFYCASPTTPKGINLHHIFFTTSKVYGWLPDIENTTLSTSPLVRCFGKVNKQVSVNLWQSWFVVVWLNYAGLSLPAPDRQWNIWPAELLSQHNCGWRDIVRIYFLSAFLFFLFFASYLMSGMSPVVTRLKNKRNN